MPEEQKMGESQAGSRLKRNKQVDPLKFSTKKTEANIEVSSSLLQQKAETLMNNLLVYKVFYNQDDSTPQESQRDKKDDQAGENTAKKR